MPAEVKILVVDDESSITILCQHLLELSGYSVVTAPDPTEAFQALESQKIDLLLTDIRLPEMDGFELVEQALKLQPELAVVVMTGYRTVETAIQALRSGVDGLVIKPYELGPELVEVIGQALESSHRKQSATSLPELEPLLRLSGAALVDTSPQTMQSLILAAMRDLTHAEAAGVYTRAIGSGGLRLVVGSGSLPDVGDPFWQNEAVAQACAGEPLGRLLAPSTTSLAAEQGWGSLLLVSIKRRKETLVFLAARPVGAKVFRRADLDLMSGFARQASVSLENTRLFHRLSTFARRAEERGGLFELVERMELLQKLMPALIHEVNNPLHAVKNNLYLAGRAGQPGERLQGYLGTAQQELYRLEIILQRILALAEPVCEDVGAVDMEQLLAQALEIFQTRLKEHNIQVKLAVTRPLPVVNGVRDRLRLVLYSLLENAIEALAGQAGEKLIWIDAAQVEDHLHLLVEDSGPGLAQEARGSLFKPFFTTRTDSSGLGLTVSQRMVEWHGGKITAQPPRHGQGLCVRIELPAG